MSDNIWTFPSKNHEPARGHQSPDKWKIPQNYCCLFSDARDVTIHHVTLKAITFSHYYISKPILSHIIK